MYIEREDDGIWLRDMPMWVVDTLLTLPEWIESDNPDVKKRLHPNAYQDEEQDREWREALGPSLEHLVAKRTEIVRGDLHKLQISDFGGALEDGEQPPPDDPDPSEDEAASLVQQTLFEVFVPAAHVAAWVSTLQAGTHAIFILEGLTEADLSQDPVGEIDPEKHISMVRLSILQDILVRFLDDGT